MLAAVTRMDVIVFSVAILVTFALLLAVFFLGIWFVRRKDSNSPYSKLPLRRGADIHWMSAEKILRFLFEMRQYDNRIFDLKKAAVCRETGRIFPDSLTWYDRLEVDWSFLEKRFPGHYVSWGSLTEEQQRAVRAAHDSLQGYQTKLSSPSPSPRQIEPEYAFAVPGPLYVDVDTFVLLGWKSIPDTDFEVLVVQKPKTDYSQRISLPEEDEETS